MCTKPAGSVAGHNQPGDLALRELELSLGRQADQPKQYWLSKMSRVRAKYRLAYYGGDPHIAANYTGTWPAVSHDGQIVVGGDQDDARLLRATVLEMSHPIFGQLRGLYTESLDAYLVLPDYTTIEFNTEEKPGYIYSQDRHIEPPEFDLVLWKPQLIGIPYSASFAGLTHVELKLIGECRDAEYREKLRISPPED